MGVTSDRPAPSLRRRQRGTGAPGRGLDLWRLRGDDRTEGSLSTLHGRQAAPAVSRRRRRVPTAPDGTKGAASSRGHGVPAEPPRCVDCGERDPIVLEFDHVDGKRAAISAVVGSWSRDRLVAEIAKCEVRCANCHARRTASQLRYYKYVTFGPNFWPGGSRGRHN